MNKFKEANMKFCTGLDYNSKCCKRFKGAGKLIRRYARRKLKRLVEEYE